MHEHHYALQIFQAAEKHARETGSDCVLEIRLTLGKDSGFTAENISTYFDIISEGSICEGAKLTFNLVTPLLRCRTCGKLFARKPFSFACDGENCTGEGEPTEIGKEFVIDSILVK
jgi:hydrogenase nickel incorporation protein HypA/HybF